jgi:hypothetical protein
VIAQVEPLSFQECLKVNTAAFVRKVARASLWEEALDSGDVEKVISFLRDETGRVSLWRIGTDQELRRAAIALNEGRDSLKERLDLLAILPDELKQVEIRCTRTQGASDCPPAAALHYEADMDEGECRRLLELLLAARRVLGRCTRGKMIQAVELSQREGCFAAAQDSSSCACGEFRRLDE